MRKSSLKENKVKKAVARGEKVYGVFVSTASPRIVEIAGYADLDYVIVDNEHGAINDETLENMVRAGERVDLTVLVRIVENRDSIILKVLDLGADGVLVPHVCTKEAAQAAVQAARYYPDGHRGQMSTGRRAGYGSINSREYLTGMSKEVMVMLMIEDAEGVENIEEIVSVPGIDVIVVGQGDLSQSMGLLGQPNHPDVLEARDRVIAAARGAGIALTGQDLITVGSDHSTLLTGFAGALKAAKDTT